MHKALAKRAKELGLKGKRAARFIYGIMRAAGYKPKKKTKRKR